MQGHAEPGTPQNSNPTLNYSADPNPTENRRSQPYRTPTRGGLRLGGSFPLDGARRLACHVEHHAVDLTDLVGDPGRDPRQHVKWHSGPVGGHSVLGGDRAQHDRVTVASAVA